MIKENIKTVLSPIKRGYNMVQLTKLVKEITETTTVDDEEVTTVVSRNYNHVSIPITEANSIRETDSGEVDDDGNTIMTYTDPIEEDFETYFNQGLAIELENKKEEVKQAVTDYRDKLRETTTIDYNGHAQKIRRQDLSDIDMKGAQMVRKGVDTAYWSFSDESTALLTLEDFYAIGDEAEALVTELYRKEAVVKAQIKAITDYDTLIAFDYATAWSNA